MEGPPPAPGATPGAATVEAGGATPDVFLGGPGVSLSADLLSQAPIANSTRTAPAGASKKATSVFNLGASEPGGPRPRPASMGVRRQGRVRRLARELRPSPPPPPRRRSLGPPTRCLYPAPRDPEPSPRPRGHPGSP